MVQPPITVTPSTANVSDQSYTFILHQNYSYYGCSKSCWWTGGGGATTPFFLGDDDAPNSKTLVAKSVRLSSQTTFCKWYIPSKSTQLTIVGNDTGATISITVKNSVILGALDQTLFP